MKWIHVNDCLPNCDYSKLNGHNSEEMWTCLVKHSDGEVTVCDYLNRDKDYVNGRKANPDYTGWYSSGDDGLFIGNGADTDIEYWVYLSDVVDLIETP